MVNILGKLNFICQTSFSWLDFEFSVHYMSTYVYTEWLTISLDFAMSTYVYTVWLTVFLDYAMSTYVYTELLTVFLDYAMVSVCQRTLS